MIITEVIILIITSRLLKKTLFNKVKRKNRYKNLLKKPNNIYRENPIN
jgi:hypothetical protein